MTNEDIKNYQWKDSLPRDMYEWMCENYEYVPDGADIPGAKWETCCMAGNDFKYGRIKICTEKMLRRNLTFSEFYRGGIVD